MYYYKKNYNKSLSNNFWKQKDFEDFVRYCFDRKRGWPQYRRSEDTEGERKRKGEERFDLRIARDEDAGAASKRGETSRMLYRKGADLPHHGVHNPGETSRIFARLPRRTLLQQHAWEK